MERKNNKFLAAPALKEGKEREKKISEEFKFD